MFPRRPPPPPTEHRPLGWGAALAASVPLYLAWIPVLIFSMLLSQALMPESAPQDTLKVFTEAGPLHQALIFLGAAIGAPVAEELVFRGRLYPMLKSRLGMTNAAALGALVFSLIHAYPAGLLSLFLFGLMLTYAYERHGSVKVPILLHFMNNGVSLAVALLAPLPPPAPPADTAAPPPAVAPESPR